MSYPYCLTRIKRKAPIGSADAPNVSPEEEAIKRNYKYSGFWRRVFAYSIDAILLGIIGLALGFTFYEHFLAIGQTGRLYGLVIYLAYFATMNSKIGNGQTLGKRMLGIKVVGLDGSTLTFGERERGQCSKRKFKRSKTMTHPNQVFPILPHPLLESIQIS